MATNEFGVTYQTVRQQELPFLDDFSASSSPTSTTVSVYVAQKAADLHGKLLSAGINAEDWATTTYAPYQWCQETLTLMVALKILRVMTQQYPEVLKRIADEVKERLKALEEGGGTAIGDSALDATSGDSHPAGPHTHISELDLSVGDDPAGDASDAAPLLRQSDEL